MNSMDLIHNSQKMNEARQSFMDALAKNDKDALMDALQQMMDVHAEQLMADYNDLQQETDLRILAQRGVRQLTSEERKYYQKVIEAMKSADPKQAITGLDAVMPTTVIDAVFEDLETNHPLLSRIDFTPTNGLIEMIMNTDATQMAKWGPLCGEITKELQSGFKKIPATLYKLTAFLPVCKAMLDLGPVWLDTYVRRVLAEALANGLEYGIIMGDGKDAPIGMIRQSGEGVTVTGGIYPEKEAIELAEINPETIGNLLSIMAMGPNGKTRVVNGVIFLVNGQDYYQKVMPATTVMAPDGTYRNDVMPFPMDVIPTWALPRGKAIIGIARKYFAPVGMAKEGRIEYSDEYRFLEDERVYIIKLYANGMPKDDNAFLVVDISGLQPASYKVTQVDGRTPSSDATLSSLSLGNAKLTPQFTAETETYAASTTNVTNVVNAVPANAGAVIKVLVNDVEINNGTSAEWKDGENTVKVIVTAEDDATTKTYTVTVTKA